MSISSCRTRPRAIGNGTRVEMGELASSLTRVSAGDLARKEAIVDISWAGSEQSSSVSVIFAHPRDSKRAISQIKKKWNRYLLHRRDCALGGIFLNPRFARQAEGRSNGRSGGRISWQRGPTGTPCATPPRHWMRSEFLRGQDRVGAPDPERLYEYARSQRIVAEADHRGGGGAAHCQEWRRR